MVNSSNDNLTPKLYRVILPVNDIEKAQIFYSKLLNMEIATKKLIVINDEEKIN